MGDHVKLDVYKIDGSKSGEQVDLQKSIFEIKPNDHVLWLAVNVEMTNRRQGTVSTKNRSAVRGGGRKPWKQKGRGGARAGTSRSPVWVGGGRTFGPSPRDLHKDIPKKMSRLARRSALSYKAKDEKITMVEDFSFDTPKTRNIADMLTSLDLNNKKTLILVPEKNDAVYLSCRNIPRLEIREATDFSTYDILKADVLLIQKSGLAKINEVLAK